METLKNKIRTARKSHKCMWCGELIPKGERYYCSTNKDEDTLYQWKNHLHCMELAEKLNMFDSYSATDGITEEMFKEFVSEYLGDKLIDNSSAVKTACELLEIDYMKG